jgi:diaminopimelate decarboxylase
VCRVVDVKESGSHQLIGVNASSAQFPRPLLYGETAVHPVMVLNNKSPKSLDKIESSVYGCSTYSRDFLASRVMLPQISEGDTLVFGDAGAYCASLYTRFLGFNEAEEFFYEN